MYINLQGRIEVVGEGGGLPTPKLAAMRVIPTPEQILFQQMYSLSFIKADLIIWGKMNLSNGGGGQLFFTLSAEKGYFKCPPPLAASGGKTYLRGGEKRNLARPCEKSPAYMN